uniref:Uncharacterized protein n=2 Tax=viral metagenome TaxID=1070528 RepID=A0A6M3XZB0_9ZZZZ
MGVKQQTMNIKLNISERLFAISILNEFKGGLDKLAIILEDIKKFTITEAEWTQAEKKEIKQGGNVNWTWNDAKGGETDIDIQKETLDWLTTRIQEKDEKGEYTLQDRAIISLSSKLK